MTKADIPKKYHRLYERAMSGKSRRAAIRCFCLECVAWQELEVRLCTAPSCPLFNYRLGKAPEPPAQGGDAVARIDAVDAERRPDGGKKLPGLERVATAGT